MKTLKRQIEEAEEKISQEKRQKRKILRDFNELSESNELMSREINTIRSKLTYVLITYLHLNIIIFFK